MAGFKGTQPFFVIGIMESKKSLRKVGKKKNAILIFDTLRQYYRSTVREG